MTDRAQFEAMLEALINEDQDAAKEIFHNIVVAKSREIYQELLENDFGQDQGNPYAANEVEEAANPFASDDEESDDSEADDSEDDSEADDAEDDSEADDSEGEEEPFGDEEGEESEEGEGDMEDRVMDLEDALEDLKAEFEQLLAGEDAEEADHPGIHDMGGADAEMPTDGAMPAAGPDELDSLMEYVDKVGAPKHGDNGTNTRSTIDNMKNDMGGTTANIAKSFSTEKGGTQGGLAAPTTKPQDGGNVNVPGAKNATKLKPVTKGHGAEKAGTKETADNKQSTLRPLKK